MLKTSSSTNLASMTAMLADYVSRIHTLLRPLVFQSKTCTSNKFTQQEITDVNLSQEFKCLKQALQKCTEVEQVMFKFIKEEKGLVVEIMGLIKQIQYFAQASIWKKQNKTYEKIINYKFSELKESISQLPFAKFQPFFQKIGKKIKQSDCIVEKSIKLQNQNIELKQKLGKCQYANTLLEEKVKKLNRQIKISEITACDDSSKRLIDRISGHIFSQQFMMKANFQVRHEIQNLRRDNQRLKAELRKSKQVNLKIKQKYAIGQNNQTNLIGQKRFNSFKPVSPDWSQSIDKLEREIISLRKQRIKEEKVINNIQDKLVDIQMLGQSKINHKARWSQLRDSRDEDQTLNMFLNKNEVKHINDAQKKSYRSDQNINLIKANRRIATEYESSLPYCKSSQTLKQSGTCTMNPTQKHKWTENEQQLKTSGYFKQPQDSSIYSHKTNKGNTKQHYRRVTEHECKTSSTLA